MSKADLHVHSMYSKHPSHWFLQRIGASESYTHPEFIYRTALERGMDFVTITDHNRIDGAMWLKERFPKQVITGVESTAYFPEDGCKVHVLIYGLSSQEFDEVQRLRENIYDLRDFLLARGLAHSVAHATYSVNGRLTLAHLEKLILLFDVFEGINGARNRLHNSTWMRVLHQLTPDIMEDLYAAHRIKPASDDPWIKGFTAGSDDHAGLFIGKTYTLANATGVEDYLGSLRIKKSLPDGRHNNYQSLAFMIYKIAYDFSKSRGSGPAKSLFANITESVFGRGSLSLKNQLSAKLLKSKKEHRDGNIRILLLEMLESLKGDYRDDMESRIDMVYEKISDITDGFFSIIIDSLMKDISSGNLEGFLRSVSSSLIGVFLSAPFFTTMKVMYEGRGLLNELARRFDLNKEGTGRRILWFTDTFDELNGVASTLREISRLTYPPGVKIRVVTCLSSRQGQPEPAVIDLPSFYGFRVPNYETIELRVPSMLKSIRQLCEYDPGEVFISTPGPVGLLGLLLARLMNIKCTGIYHTDFSMQARQLVDDDSLFEIVESYTRWFYSSTDEVLVPTREYMEILEARGIDRPKMRLFKRAIDASLFTPEAAAPGLYAERYDLVHEFTLLYAGRISRDKNLDFLLEVYGRLRRQGADIHLLIAGDGPDLEVYRKKHEKVEGLVFTGRIDRHQMPRLYASADLLVFPSITDTFGMVVLEAQACGLPALVSNIGGPQEVVINGHSGSILDATDTAEWVREISSYVEMKKRDIEGYRELREMCRVNAVKYNWESAFESILGPPETFRGDKSAPVAETSRIGMEATV